MPYALVKQQLDVRLSAQVVEVFHKGKRVASHQRSPHKGQGFQGAKFHVNKFNVLQIIVQIILMKKGI